MKSSTRVTGACIGLASDHRQPLFDRDVRLANDYGFRRYVLGRALTIAQGQGTVGGIKYDLEKLGITLAGFARAG